MLLTRRPLPRSGESFGFPRCVLKRARRRCSAERVVRCSPRAGIVQVEAGIEIGSGSRLGRVLEVMDQRIDIALCDIRVGYQIVFGVKQPGFSYVVVVAEQRFHYISRAANRKPRTARSDRARGGRTRGD